MRSDFLLVLATLLPVAGCHPAAWPRSQSPGGAAAPLVRVTTDLDPVREVFNAGKDKPRFVALLSPT